VLYFCSDADSFAPELHCSFVILDRVIGASVL